MSEPELDLASAQETTMMMMPAICTGDFGAFDPDYEEEVAEFMRSDYEARLEREWNERAAEKQRGDMMLWRSLQCEECGKFLANAIGMRNHRRWHHYTRKMSDTVGVLSCDLCEYKTIYKSNMKRHRSACIKQTEQPESWHARQKSSLSLQSKNECAECGAQFKYKRSLQMHVARYHTAGRSCPVCFEVFASDQAAVAHMRLFHASQAKHFVDNSNPKEPIVLYRRHKLRNTERTVKK